MTFRIGNQRLMAFEHDDAVAIPRRLARDVDAPRGDIFRFDFEKTRHFSGMRRDDARPALRIDLLRASGERVQR